MVRGRGKGRAGMEGERGRKIGRIGMEGERKKEKDREVRSGR